MRLAMAEVSDCSYIPGLSRAVLVQVHERREQGRDGEGNRRLLRLSVIAL